VISSSVLLWSFAAFLVVAAFRRKQVRAAEIRERWELEDWAVGRPPEEEEPGPN
jgi:hypothetical protein